MAENPVRKLFSDPEDKPGIAKELGETARSYQIGKQALKEPTSPAMPVKPAPVKLSPADKINPKGAYGDKPGEKRIDTSYPDSPMPKMHKGGEVQKTGPHILKKGEHVMTEAKHDKLQKAMGLAADALSHEKDSEPVDLPSAKIDKEMNVRRLDDKSFHIRHKHKAPHDMPEHDEEYSVPDIKALKKHMEDHFGKEEEEHESPGVEAAEKAVGME